jgi:hypothetical protein
MLGWVFERNSARIGTKPAHEVDRLEFPSPVDASASAALRAPPHTPRKIQLLTIAPRVGAAQRCSLIGL